MALTYLLHGFACLPSMWDGVLPYIGDARALLLPGHGPTPQLPDTTRFMDVVDLLAASLHAPAHLVGYSLGGRLALTLALRHPERIASLWLIGARAGLADPAERRAWDLAQAEALERDGLEAFMQRWESLPLFATQSDAQRRRMRRERLAHTAGGLAWVMRVLGLGNMPPSPLERATFPLHLIVGELDHKYVAEARHIAAHTGASLTVVPGCGHNVVLEGITTDA